MTGWLLQHRQALAQALRRLRAAPLTTVLAALVLGIALALPAGGEMMLGNLQRLAQRIAATPQISVFMKLGVASAALEKVEQQLRKHPETRQVRFVPRAATLERLRQSEGLGEIIDSLPDNPFPDAFIVLPADDSPDALESLREQFSNLPQVEHVQLDSAWVKKLDAFLRLVRLLISMLAVVLGVALVAVAFNTIRLQTLTQQDEIELSRLLGANDSYIARPFLYFGALQGLAGGLVAWIVVLLATVFLRAPIAELASLYGIEFQLRILSPADSVVLFALSALLGWVGAWLSLFRALRK